MSDRANVWLFNKVQEAVGTDRFWSAWRMYVSHCIKHGYDVEHLPLPLSEVKNLRKEARNVETHIQLPLI